MAKFLNERYIFRTSIKTSMSQVELVNKIGQKIEKDISKMMYLIFII